MLLQRRLQGAKLLGAFTVTLKFAVFQFDESSIRAFREEANFDFARL